MTAKLRIMLVRLSPNAPAASALMNPIAVVQFGIGGRLAFDAQPPGHAAFVTKARHEKAASDQRPDGRRRGALDMTVMLALARAHGAIATGDLECCALGR